MSEIEESVHLLSHRPEWRIQAKEEAFRISKELGMPVSDIEHIGSTAVEGLAAKPIIDLMLGARELPSEKFHAALAALGYEWLGDFPGRSYFRKRGERNFNAHVVMKNGDHWKNNLLFRDYLCRNEAARARYAQAKQAAMSSGHDTLLPYSAAKEPTLSSLLREAASVHKKNQ